MATGPPSTSENVARNTLVSCHVDLINEIARVSPHTMAGYLYENRVIAKATLDEVYQLSDTREDKARKLVDALEAKVKSFPEYFKKFLDILQTGEMRRDYKDLFTKLCKKYYELGGQELELVLSEDKGAIGAQHSGEDLHKLSKPAMNEISNGMSHGIARAVSSSDTWPSDSDSDSDEATVPMQQEKRYVRFKCACGKCSFKKYIEGTTQCDSSGPPEIKVWKPKQDDEMTREDMHYSTFEVVLKKKSREINAKFVDLLMDTFKQLELKQGNPHTLDDVKEFIKALFQPPANTYYHRMYIEGITGKLRNVTTFKDLRKYLHKNYCSWFNFELIAEIRKQFLFEPKQDEKVLAYLERFEHFVSRCCFIYLSKLGPNPSREYHTQLVCKVDIELQKLNPKLVEEFRLLVTDVVNMPRYCITLKQVREGCTELVFRVPDCLKELEELRPDQVQMLKEKNVLEMEIGGRTLLKKMLPNEVLTTVSFGAAQDDASWIEQTHIEDKGGQIYFEPEHSTDSTISGLSSDSTEETTVADVTIEGRLLRAFRTGDYQEAESLLFYTSSKLCDVKSIKDDDKMSLLHLACRGDWSKWKDIIKSLVEEYQCSITAVDEDGNTPLHVASRFQSEGAVKYLVFLDDCDHNAVNSDGYTALQIAVDKGHTLVTRAILSSGKVNQVIIDNDFFSESVETDDVSLFPLLEREMSPFQLVQRFNKVIKNNRHIQPPFKWFTSYYLLDFLKKHLQNCDSITLDDLILHIGCSKLPLPEDPNMILNLLSEIQHVTDLSVMSISGSLEDIVITAKKSEGTELTVFLPNASASSVAKVPTRRFTDKDSQQEISYLYRRVGDLVSGTPRARRHSATLSKSNLKKRESFQRNPPAVRSRPGLTLTVKLEEGYNQKMLDSKEAEIVREPIKINHWTAIAYTCCQLFSQVSVFLFALLLCLILMVLLIVYILIEDNR